ncbi:uncharacterized protein (DUF1684 family) [Nakamurella sp. UYEF19]|uniref:DUF1684 domain-containing protein n=1 Tax=Nakamurella sp. UYEF19 TaxID=1756392 RepID=UPI003390A0DB
MSLRAPVVEEAFVYQELLDWRRTVAGIYYEVGAAKSPEVGHGIWRARRDELFLHHPQSPLSAVDPLRQSGLPYWPYDPSLRFTAPLQAVEEPARLTVPSTDGAIRMVLAGRVHLGGVVDVEVDVWWLEQYGGGLFLPLRDGTSGTGSYGGGRYLLDTVKGADLGSVGTELVLDLNFLYHPSCRYSPEWSCPLAPQGNRVAVPISAGEQMPELQ